ncbi:MAG: peptide chain release factor N(5)-glutamine methyltransferase [Actinomycetota bacterium]|nr:peptide chain release factor N(5)-glutamine methyltransferase [Actinomycetota bacterium]
MSEEPSVRDLLFQAARQLGSASEARWVVEHAMAQAGAGGHVGSPGAGGHVGSPGAGSPADSAGAGGHVGSCGEPGRHQTARQLSSAGSRSAANAVVMARRHQTVPYAVVDAVHDIVERRLAGEPLQYLLGAWPFRRLELTVDHRVLIPRPETEVVVGHALDELERAVAEGGDPWPAARGPGRAWRTDQPGQGAGGGVLAVDLGTGSGAIALSLAVEGPGLLGGRTLAVWGVDDSPDALAVAQRNLVATRETYPAMADVELVEGDWFEALPRSLLGAVTLVVANPPYVSEAEWATLDPEVREHEPRRALVGGPEGGEAIDRIVQTASRWLAPWGVLVIEVAPHQADDVALQALVHGFDGVLVRPDLAGRSRAVVARRWGAR